MGCNNHDKIKLYHFSFSIPPDSDMVTCVSNVSKTIKNYTSSSKIQFEPWGGNKWLHHLIPIIRSHATNEDIMEILSEHKGDLVAALKEEGKDETLKVKKN